ncbi:MAG TPA: coenzyme F420-0:L-glutamate ligase, partial [Chloroflexota bacterium]|nr:coenzyme F420-0:L-glutamate ligase [Chloroflexota bacterium]
MDRSGALQIFGVDGIGEARAGESIARIIGAAIAEGPNGLEDGDVVVITHKIISKAEGRLVELSTVEPSALARRFAETWGKDPRQVEVVLRESKRVVRMERGILIAETRHGFICANAGVDASNVDGREVVCLQPLDSDASAEAVRAHLGERFGVDVGVIVTDSFGRPWRAATTDVAIGAAGVTVVRDLAGELDPAGYELHATRIAVGDE